MPLQSTTGWERLRTEGTSPRKSKEWTKTPTSSNPNDPTTSQRALASIKGAPPASAEAKKSEEERRKERRRNLFDESLHIDLFDEIDKELGQGQSGHSSLHSKASEEKKKQVPKRASTSPSVAPLLTASNAIRLPPPLSSSGEDPQAIVRRLQEALSTQQKHLAQAKRALDFCLGNDDFRGSTREIDAHYTLLLTTEKRHAIQSELEKLIDATALDHSTTRGWHPTSSATLPPPKQSTTRQYEPLAALSISSLAVQLSEQFTKERGVARFALVALIKIGESVIPTPMVYTEQQGGRGERWAVELIDGDPINIVGFSPNTTPLLEIYCMKAYPDPIDRDEVEDKAQISTMSLGSLLDRTPMLGRSRLGSFLSRDTLPPKSVTGVRTMTKKSASHQGRQPANTEQPANKGKTGSEKQGFQCAGRLEVKMSAADVVTKCKLAEPRYPLEGSIQLRMCHSIYLSGSTNPY